MKFDTKTEARLRILRNAAEICRLISDEVDLESCIQWIDLDNMLRKAAETIENEALDES